MKIGVFHPGTQHSWQTALAFQETNQLAWYATSIFYNPLRWPYRIESYLPQAPKARLHREFTRRFFPPLNPEKVRQIGMWRWIERGTSRARLRALTLWCGSLANKEYTRGVIQLMEKEPPDIVWGYDTASLDIFRWAKKRGIRCVLDQTTGHTRAYNQVLLEERDRHPEFFVPSFRPLNDEWISRCMEEIELADLVVVGSDFCASTMIQHGCPAEKLRIVPYGFDEETFLAPAPRKKPSRTPLEFLFVGQLSPRKGTAYLLKAFEQLPKSAASITMVGAIGIPLSTYERYASRFQHIGSTPRCEMVEHYRRAGCFVFPSLFEGSALVLYEACGAGLGIIQSSSSGCGATAGVNGAILDPVTVPRLLEQLTTLVENPSLLDEWQEASLKIRTHYPWSCYRARVRELIFELDGRKYAPSAHPVVFHHI